MNVIIIHVTYTVIKMGEITKKIHDLWSKNVGVNIHQQIRDFSRECKKLNKQQPTPYQFNPDE